MIFNQIKIKNKKLKTKMKNKRGVSALVATVLLVLITIAAVGLIWGAILPLIQRGMQQGQGCGLETRLSINTRGGYTCYNSVSNAASVVVERPTTDFELAGLTLAISGQGMKNAYEIREGGLISQTGKNCSSGEIYNMDGTCITTTGDCNCAVYFYNGTNYVSDLQLPGKGEARTYLVRGLPYKASRAEVSPIVKVGSTEVACQVSAGEDLPKCSS